jgi:hypothetical protein
MCPARLGVEIHTPSFPTTERPRRLSARPVVPGCVGRRTGSTRCRCAWWPGARRRRGPSRGCRSWRNRTHVPCVRGEIRAGLVGAEQSGGAVQLRKAGDIEDERQLDRVGGAEPSVQGVGAPGELVGVGGGLGMGGMRAGHGPAPAHNASPVTAERSSPKDASGRVFRYVSTSRAGSGCARAAASSTSPVVEVAYLPTGTGERFPPSALVPMSRPTSALGARRSGPAATDPAGCVPRASLKGLSPSSGSWCDSVRRSTPASAEAASTKRLSEISAKASA